MNSHEHCAALLDAFIDGALSQPEAEQVRAHLTECPECREYVSDALTMRELFPGVEETLVPDGFAERVLSGLPPQNPAQNRLWRTPSQNVRRRTLRRKIALPLAACATLVLLVGGIWRGVSLRDRVTGGAAESGGGATQSATFQAAGYDMDIDEAAPESAENTSAADTGMDGGAMPESVTGGAFENDRDSGAASGNNTNANGAALKRTYEPPETAETEESAVFDFGVTAPTLYDGAAEFPETSALGGSYDALDSADTLPPQTAETKSAPQSDSVTSQDTESDAAPIPEPDEKRVSGASQSQRVSDASQPESAAASVDDSSTQAAAESVTVSFWTLSPDAALLLEQYPVSQTTDSGAWYALTPEQFDALRGSLPESAFTPMDADSLSANPPPLRDRAPIYLFLPRPD